jgi:2-(1,2-epoxy-1,2-dihydrophenyl)acetyl-CoA isomerase
MNPLVLHQRDGPVTILTLNRAQRHNSFIPTLLEDLLAALEKTRADPEVRAVILCAKGRSFSTGGDIQGFYDNLHNIKSYSKQIVGLLNQVILDMLNLPAVTITVAHGMVTGGSLGLVLSSDIVFVSPQTRFTPYYYRVGFSPDGGWTALLPAVIGAKRVVSILAQNLTITAQQAVDWGLADRMVSQDQIFNIALKTAHDIVLHTVGNLIPARHLVFGAHEDLKMRLKAEQVVFLEQVMTEEARLGMKKFLEKKQSPYSI